MVAREVGAFLIAADGLVNTLGSLFTNAFEGELPGLGSGKRDKWAIGGVLTGNEGTDDLNGFFVGEISRTLAGILNALRVVDLRTVDAG